MPLLAEGKYAGKLISAELDTNKNEKNFVHLKFNVYSYFDGENWEPIVNVVRSMRLYLSEKAFEYTVKALVDHMGWDQKSFDEMQFEQTDGIELWLKLDSASPQFPEKWGFAQNFRAATPPSAGQKSQLNSRLQQFKRKNAQPLSTFQKPAASPAQAQPKPQQRAPQAPPPVQSAPPVEYEEEEEALSDEEIPFEETPPPVTAPPANRRAPQSPPPAPKAPAKEEYSDEHTDEEEPY